MSVKYCKDCKWCGRNWLLPMDLQQCYNPKFQKHDLITGARKKTFVGNQRMFDGTNYCSSKGKGFEPRKPWYQFWR